MMPAFQSIVLLLGVSVSCHCQLLQPEDALNRYLARSGQARSAGGYGTFSVQIDAAMPKLRKQGSMSGLKLVSRTGQVVYRALQFTGDNLVKTAVIARFLANDARRPEQRADAGLTRENYQFLYVMSTGYNGLTAHVFRLKPRRRRAGLFQGELWLEANTAAPLRLWGDFVKSPSIFIRAFRFVQDYEGLDESAHPLRLILTVNTRVAGEAEMVEWLHPVPATATAAGDGETEPAIASPAGFQNTARN